VRRELVLVIDDESADAGSLEPGIDLVIARHGSFPLHGEEWRVRVAVMDNNVSVKEVSQSIWGQEKERATHYSAISSSQVKMASLVVMECPRFCGSNVFDSAVWQRSW
jgi:hypothetical protein